MAEGALPLDHGCPSCGEVHTRPLVELPAVPVLCNVLHATREQALAAPRGDLRLMFCPTCGLIYNAAFDPALMAYNGAYENSQRFSPLFHDYLESLTQLLLDQYQLHGKTVVEVGCGDAYFLSLLCRGGDNRGYGIDPGGQEPQSEAVTVITDLEASILREIEADFVCCRHVLEHVPNPREFVRDAVAYLRGRPDGAAYFEVPNTMYTLRDMGFWDLLYEHCLYFTAPSMRGLFERSGCEVLGVQERYSGQFLSVEARPAAPSNSSEKSDAPDLKFLAELADTFKVRYQRTIQDWTGRLREFRQGGKKVAIWGTGAKGVMFLNTVPGAERIDWAVDINPRKIGCHVSGTGQPIIGPSQLPQARPDVILIMNPIYVPEIRAELDRRGVRAAVMTVN